MLRLPGRGKGKTRHVTSSYPPRVELEDEIFLPTSLLILIRNKLYPRIIQHFKINLSSQFIPSKQKVYSDLFGPPLQSLSLLFCGFSDNPLEVSLCEETL